VRKLGLSSRFKDREGHETVFKDLIDPVYVVELIQGTLSKLMVFRPEYINGPPVIESDVLLDIIKTVGARK
jgi:hypothetical protein